MDLASVDRLLARARSGKDTAWPIPEEEPILRALNTWVALAESIKDRLRIVAEWPENRPYRVDPLPERIAEAWAHYQYGQEPAVVGVSDADTALYDDMLETDFPSELERAGGICVAEGEVWSRVYVDDTVAPRPLLEWHSRASVFPLWIGKRLMAAAIVTELPALPTDAKGTIYRAFEIHAAGVVVNVLFRGRDAKDGAVGRLGQPVDLEAHPDTAGLDPMWRHDLPGMLLHRIPNRLRRDPRLGVSDFKGILDYLLDINEAASIGASNVRLTGRKRAIVSASAVEARTGLDTLVDDSSSNAGQGRTPPRPRFDANEEVFIEDPLDAELGKAGSSPFRVLEYSFDAEALIAWKKDLVESAVSRVGLAVQYVGVGTDQGGYAISGTALRLRLIPTDATGRGKTRYRDDVIPRILSTMAQVDALSTEAGGFGRAWTDPGELPTVTFRPGLPTDETEEAQRHATLVNAGLESKHNAVRELHPDWTPQQVDEEVALIESAAPATIPAFGA